MPAAVTQTEIINGAAALLGAAERVTSIDTNNSLGIAASAVWDIALRTLLSDHPWNPFIKRGVLNAAATAAAFGYERAFALPADCLRVLQSRTDDADDFFEGEVESGHIHSDAEAPLYVRYISNDLADDVSRWPPHFAEAMMWKLAELMAETLTGSQSIANRMSETADYKLKRAKRVDGLETAPRDRNRVSSRSNWLAGRNQPYNRWSR